MSEDLQLGKVIEPGRQVERDCIHIAVAPVVADHPLLRGQPVGVADNGRLATTVFPSVGIVDPFLTRDVEEGERFWLYLFPGSITSLRHEWTHPSFDPEPRSLRVPHRFSGKAAGPHLPSWHTPTVLALLAGVRQAEGYDGAPVLADALEEAGFADGDVLETLRSERAVDEWGGDGEWKKRVADALDAVEDDDTPEFSEKWLRRYALKQNSYDTPDEAFKRLVDGLRSGELFFHGSDLHGLYGLDDADELKRHGERYLKVRIDWGRFSFSCSC